MLGRAPRPPSLLSSGACLLPRHPALPLVGTPGCPRDAVQTAGCPWVPCGALVCVRVCVRVPSLARALFVFLLIGLFFHVQPTKPHVFPLLSPACLGWSPRHARGLPGAQRGGGAGGPQPWPAQIRLGRAGQDPSSSSPALALPTLPSCLTFKGHGLSQPHLVAALDLSQRLPPPPTSHRLLFPSQPTGLRAKSSCTRGPGASILTNQTQMSKTG